VVKNGLRISKLGYFYKERFGRSFNKHTGLDLEELVKNATHYVEYKDAKVFPKEVRESKRRHTISTNTTKSYKRQRTNEFFQKNGINNYLGRHELFLIFSFLSEMEVTDVVTKVCKFWALLAKRHFNKYFLSRKLFVEKHFQKIQATRRHLLKRSGRDLSRIHVANIEEPITFQKLCEASLYLACYVPISPNMQTKNSLG